jgi:hypothetical protein
MTQVYKVGKCLNFKKIKGNANRKITCIFIKKNDEEILTKLSFFCRRW